MREEVVLAEKKLLSCIARNPSIIFDLDTELIDKEHFYHWKSRIIFSALKSLAYKHNSVDELLLQEEVASQFPKAYESKKQEIVSGIKKVFVENSSDLHIGEYVRIIINNSVYRNAEGEFGRILEKISVENDPLININTIESNILHMTSKFYKTEGTKKLGRNLENYISEIVDIINSGEEVKLGIPTGFKEYDRLVGGHRRGTVNILISGQKMGKSFLCSNIAYNVASQGTKVLMLDTELNEKGQTFRMASIQYKVPINVIESGEFIDNDEAFDKISKACKEMASLPIYYEDICGWPVSKQISYIRRWVRREVGIDDKGETNDCFVILDYLKIMSKDDRNDMKEWEALYHGISEIHDLAKELQITIFIPVQDNADGEVSGTKRLRWLCDSMAELRLKPFNEIRAMESQIKSGIYKENRFSNLKLKVPYARWGPGTQGDLYVGVYADIHDSRKMDCACGIFREVGLERPCEKK